MYVFNAAMKLFLRKGFRFILFLLMAAALISAFALIGQGLLYNDILTEPLGVIIVDNDDSPESHMFVSAFLNHEPYKNIVDFRVLTQTYAYAEIKANNAAAILIIPRDFAESVKSGENEPFTVILNEAQPLKSLLARYFAESFGEILAANQKGIYAALDYTYQNHPDRYDYVFTVINLKFLNMVINRQDIFDVKTVLTVNHIPVFTHFALSLWIMLNIACGVLFFDIISINFNPIVLKKLRLTGISVYSFALQLNIAVFLALITINLLFIPVMPDITLYFILRALICLMCISTLIVCVSFMFKNAEAACVIHGAASLICLFLSGGVIPKEYFGKRLANVSYFTLNYWLYETLINKNSAAVIIAALFAFCFFVVSALFIKKIYAVDFR